MENPLNYTVDQLINFKFNHYANEWHSTQEHYPTFYHFGTKCEAIAEFGVDIGYSSWSWVGCKPKWLRCVDIMKSGAPDQQIDDLMYLVKRSNIDFEFELADTGHGTLKKITETRDLVEPILIDLDQPYYNLEQDIDLLYIDTYHSYTHLSAELKLHGNKVKKYLIFHDTDSFGERHDFDGDKGLNYAIEEFLESNSQWHVIHKVAYSFGLTVLANKLNTIDEPNLDPEFRYPHINLPI